MNLEKNSTFFSTFTKVVRVVLSAVIVGVAIILISATLADPAGDPGGGLSSLLGLALLALVARSWSKGIPRLIATIATTLFFILTLLSCIAMMANSRDDYSLKAKASEAYSISKPVLKAVEIYYQQHHKFPNNNQMVELSNIGNMAGTYVAKVGVGNNGTVTAVYNEKIDQPLKGLTIQFRPTIAEDGKRIVWDCKGGTLPKKYRSKSSLAEYCQ